MLNPHNSAVRGALSPLYKEARSDLAMMRRAQETAAVSFLCAGQGGLRGATGVRGDHSWGQNPGHSPEPTPITSPRALPGSELLGG